jgi:hypothetical protein
VLDLLPKTLTRILFRALCDGVSPLTRAFCVSSIVVYGQPLWIHGSHTGWRLQLNIWGCPDMQFATEYNLGKRLAIYSARLATLPILLALFPVSLAVFLSGCVLCCGCLVQAYPAALSCSLRSAVDG